MRKPTIFDFQAQVGLTKHLGGFDATLALIEGCQIDGKERVLEIGCGVGTTSVYLAKHHGCQVTGVDLSERMIQRARERARAEKVDDLTSFRPADMDQLPFPSDSFDVILCESVLAFSQEKSRAIQEMARVTVPGGHVAINESIWLEDPTEEMKAWFSQDMAAQATTLRFEGWMELLEQAGLTPITWEKSRIEVKNEVRGLIKRYGWRGLLKSLARGLIMYFQRPDYRQFLAETRKTGITPENPERYMGYAIIVCQKPSFN